MSYDYYKIIIYKDDEPEKIFYFDAWPAVKTTDFDFTDGNGVEQTLTPLGWDGSDYIFDGYDDYEVNTLGGGRYSEKFIAITDKGEIFYQ